MANRVSIAPLALIATRLCCRRLAGIFNGITGIRGSDRGRVNHADFPLACNLLALALTK